MLIPRASGQCLHLKGSNATKEKESSGPSADHKYEAWLSEPTIDIEPESLSESSLFIRDPRFVSKLRTGERFPTTVTDTEDEEERVGSEIVTLMVQEVSGDAEVDGVRESVEKDKLAEISIKTEQD